MEFELPKINVSFEYDEEKDEIVFVINGVEKRVKTEDMITEMEKLHEQNTALEQEPCDDAISRQAMHIELEKWITYGEYKYSNATKYLYDRIDRLPPSTPKPKTGHWIYICNSEVNGLKICKCSNCKKKTYGSHKYCPNCGAKMESEGKK